MLLFLGIFCQESLESLPSNIFQLCKNRRFQLLWMVFMMVNVVVFDQVDIEICITIQTCSQKPMTKINAYQHYSYCSRWLFQEMGYMAHTWVNIGITGNGHLILQVSSSNLVSKGLKLALTNNHSAWYWWILLWEGKTCVICMLGRLVVLSRMVKAWKPSNHTHHQCHYLPIPSRPFIHRCKTFTNETTYIFAV